jgi:hypothetical protein
VIPQHPRDEIHQGPRSEVAGRLAMSERSYRKQRVAVEVDAGNAEMKPTLEALITKEGTDVSAEEDQWPGR